MSELNQNNDNPFWMVITLKSGTQAQMMVTEYTIKRAPITGQLTSMNWTRHPDSPTNLTELDLAEVAMVHTEWIKDTTNA